MKKTVNESEVNIPDLVAENPLDLFNGKRIEIIVEQVETAVRSVTGLDPEDPKDYKLYGSIGSKISKTKVALDKAGESIVKPLKEQCKEFDAKRKFLKDRLGALREEFLVPRSEFDKAQELKAREVAEAFDLFTHGHSKVGEFGKPTLELWDSAVQKIDLFEVTKELFADRYDEALESQANGLDLIKRKREQWIDDQKALEAGRIALKEKEDKEAAERHAVAELEKKTHATSIEPAPPKSPSETLVEKQARVHRVIVSQLLEVGVDEELAKGIIISIFKGSIPNLSINYEV